jgi:hypothetical protein
VGAGGVSAVEVPRSEREQKAHSRVHNQLECRPLDLMDAVTGGACVGRWTWLMQSGFKGAGSPWSGWKKECSKAYTGVPYKVYNSVPVVLYLKPFRTTGCTYRD